ncbi:MAG: hypothetical protein ACRES7_06490 [Gammaproteobacteria bacterium]
MREIQDELGRRWQVAVAFGSYGEQCMVFSCMVGDELRTAPMQAATQREGEVELAGLTDAALHDRLSQAQPWQ